MCTASGAADITPEKLIPGPSVSEAVGAAATLELSEKAATTGEAPPDVGVAIRCVLITLFHLLQVQCFGLYSKTSPFARIWPV